MAKLTSNMKSVVNIQKMTKGLSLRQRVNEMKPIVHRNLLMEGEETKRGSSTQQAKAVASFEKQFSNFSTMIRNQSVRNANPHAQG
jgi:hypothetical protein